MRKPAKKDALKAVSKAHVVYKTSDGRRVPGTTTITGMLNKPTLVSWANRLGLEGIDSSKYVDAAAEIGTAAHRMIECYFTGDTFEKEMYSPHALSLAENSMISFYEWADRHEIEVQGTEMQLTSDTLLYGGTIDCLCTIDGVPTLLDFKTSKAIYDEHFIQLAAYRALLEEAGHPVERCRILRVGRDETEGFEERTIIDTSKHFEIFEHLLKVYYLRREIGREFKS